MRAALQPCRSCVARNGREGVRVNKDRLGKRKIEVRVSATIEGHTPHAARAADAAHSDNEARDGFGSLNRAVIAATARRYKDEGITPESIESGERCVPTNWAELVVRAHDELERLLEKPEGHEAYRRLRMDRDELFVRSKGNFPSLGDEARALSESALWIDQGGPPCDRPGRPRDKEDDERLEIDAVVGLARVDAAKLKGGAGQLLLAYAKQLVHQRETEIASQEERPMISEHEIEQKATEWIETSYYLRKLSKQATAKEWPVFMNWLASGETFEPPDSTPE